MKKEKRSVIVRVYETKNGDYVKGSELCFTSKKSLKTTKNAVKILRPYLIK